MNSTHHTHLGASHRKSFPYTHTHTPILRFIPRRLRIETCHALTRTLWNYVMAETPERKHNAYVHLFIFLSCILCAIQPATERNGQDCSSLTLSTNNTIRARISHWSANENQSLWHDTLQHAKEHARKPQTFSSQSLASFEKANVKRARKLARVGAFAKATQPLSSRGVFNLTDAVLQYWKRNTLGPHRQPMDNTTFTRRKNSNCNQSHIAPIKTYEVLAST